MNNVIIVRKIIIFMAKYVQKTSTTSRSELTEGAFSVVMFGPQACHARDWIMSAVFADGLQAKFF